MTKTTRIGILLSAYSRGTVETSLKSLTVRNLLVKELSSPFLIRVPTSVSVMVFMLNRLFLGRPSLPETSGESLPW